MKKRLLPIILLLITGYSLTAQDGWKCGTPTFKRMAPPGYQQTSITTGSRSDSATLYIPVTVNILGDNNGNGYYTLRQTLDALCKLQADFDDHGFHFYLENLNYINSSTFYNMSASYVFSDGMYQFIEDHNTQNTMNVYIVQNAGGYSFVSAKDFDWDYSSYPPPQIFTHAQSVVMAKNHLNSTEHLFTHEVGHYFGLYHTFDGGNWNEFAVNGTPDSVFYTIFDPVNDTTLALYWLVERADGINCGISGDLICDTPPDYLTNGFQCNANQESNTVQIDPTGATFRSDGTLYMSYSNDACQSRFSPGQVEKMRTVAEGPRSYLLYNQTPPDTISFSDLTLVFPPQNETIPVGDSIVLEWELPGATSYFVTFGELNGTAIFQNMLLDTSFLKVDVEPNKNYYWTVRGFNDYYYCPDLTATGQFSTEEMTSTTEPYRPGTLLIMPNPAGNFLYVQTNGISAKFIGAEIFDFQGRLYRRQSVALGIPIDVQGLTPGMYMVKIDIGEGILMGKFVKQ